MPLAYEDYFPAPAGGGTAPLYMPGRIYPVGGRNTTTTVADRDYLIPFIPRAEVEIQHVCWERDNTTAANVYVGIYDADGNLLTDCAVDANTGAGWHMVPTTPVTLSPLQTYYFGYNASADVAYSMAPDSNERWTLAMGIHVNLGASGNVASSIRTVAYFKHRTNAALLSDLVMAGWFDLSTGIAMGIAA